MACATCRVCTSCDVKILISELLYKGDGGRLVVSNTGVSSPCNMPAIQGRYWLATISFAQLNQQPCLQEPICYLKGQKEVGEGGYEHWQLLAVTSRKCTLNQVKRALHPTAHVELSRSDAADAYVWKDDTSVHGTRFELGAKPVSRARKQDWEKIVSDAKRGLFEDIPPDILVRNYSSLKRIRVDNLAPIDRTDIQVRVYWGNTGTGKTFTAHNEIRLLDKAYFDKNPLTKWWDGYRGQTLCLIDEFAGRVDIINLLRWLDRYPCTVEVKGYTLPLEVTHFWITSNIHPREWYPDAPRAHQDALLRRLTDVKHFVSLPPSV